MMRIALVAAGLALTLLACTPVSPGPATASAASTVRIGQEVRLGGLRVRAIRLVEDSRCPEGVQCIQAGTVRLAVRLAEGSRDIVLRLGEPEPIGGGRVIQLVTVCPGPGAPGSPPPPRAYRFHLAVGATVAAMPPEGRC